MKTGKWSTGILVLSLAVGIVLLFAGAPSWAQQAPEKGGSSPQNPNPQIQNPGAPAPQPSAPAPEKGKDKEKGEEYETQC